MAPSTSRAVRPQLLICSFLNSDKLIQDLQPFLTTDYFQFVNAASIPRFLEILDQQKHQIDCLILEASPELSDITEKLHQQAIVLPAVIVPPKSGLRQSGQPSIPEQTVSRQPIYHQAELWISRFQASEMGSQIDQAIGRFLKLNPACRLDLTFRTLAQPQTETAAQTFVTLQQQRLTDKLIERLGYLGVYYRRDSKSFFRRMSESEKQEFLEDLKTDYRQILLKYFRRDPGMNQMIETFVDKAFFADLSISQVLEIHMDLIDGFAKQLKLEGRSEDILLDYRLTLIDIIAHLCEMYRRSIPRES